MRKKTLQFNERKHSRVNHEQKQQHSRIIIMANKQQNQTSKACKSLTARFIVTAAAVASKSKLRKPYLQTATHLPVSSWLSYLPIYFAADTQISASLLFASPKLAHFKSEI